MEESPSGKAPGFDSGIAGSTPASSATHLKRCGKLFYPI